MSKYLLALFLHMFSKFSRISPANFSFVFVAVAISQKKTCLSNMNINFEIKNLSDIFRNEQNINQKSFYVARHKKFSYNDDIKRKINDHIEIKHSLPILYAHFFHNHK